MWNSTQIDALERLIVLRSSDNGGSATWAENKLNKLYLQNTDQDDVDALRYQIAVNTILHRNKASGLTRPKGFPSEYKIGAARVRVHPRAILRPPGQCCFQCERGHKRKRLDTLRFDCWIVQGQFKACACCVAQGGSGRCDLKFGPYKYNYCISALRTQHDIEKAILLMESLWSMIKQEALKDLVWGMGILDLYDGVFNGLKAHAQEIGSLIPEYDLVCCVTSRATKEDLLRDISTLDCLVESLDLLFLTRPFSAVKQNIDALDILKFHVGQIGAIDAPHYGRPIGYHGRWVYPRIDT